MASLPTRRVSSPSNTSIRAIPVLRKDLPRIRGCTVSFVASGSFSTTLGRKEGGGRVPELEVEALLCSQTWLKNPPSKHLVFKEPKLDKKKLGKLEVGKPRVDKQENQEVEFDLTSSEDDSWSNAFTISLSLATSGEIPEVKVFILTLATTGLLQENKFGLALNDS
nr:hypothetical protein [Tanacetum cinerariifolium]